MKTPLFTGTGVALITPFRKQQETVDFTKLESHIEHIVTSGVDYIVALGTTSEAATMTQNERSAVQEFIVETVSGRLPIILGLGGNNTLSLTDTLNRTNFDGISGLLSVTPYYNKPNQRGLIAHYRTVAEASPVPVIIYNVPGRTGVNLTAETPSPLPTNVPTSSASKRPAETFRKSWRYSATVLPASVSSAATTRSPTPCSPWVPTVSSA